MWVMPSTPICTTARRQGCQQTKRETPSRTTSRGPKRYPLLLPNDEICSNSPQSPRSHQPWTVISFKPPQIMPDHDRSGQVSSDQSSLMPSAAPPSVPSPSSSPSLTDVSASCSPSASASATPLVAGCAAPLAAACASLPSSAPAAAPLARPLPRLPADRSWPRARTPTWGVGGWGVG